MSVSPFSGSSENHHGHGTDPVTPVGSREARLAINNYVAYNIIAADQPAIENIHQPAGKWLGYSGGKHSGCASSEYCSDTAQHSEPPRVTP